ncbi:MAG: hypothetical protein HOK81_07180, partial [Rhodospirillaceae bacterium]|nr:hypothetical protein [Rhodospirillaceae bacterium]
MGFSITAVSILWPGAAFRSLGAGSSAMNAKTLAHAPIACMISWQRKGNAMRQKAKLTILAAAAWLTFACGPSQAETSDWVPISTSAARIAWDGPGLEGTLRQHIEAEIEGFSEVERAIWQDRFAVPRLSITFIALPPNRTFVSGHVPELDSQIRAWFAAAPSVQVELPGGSAGA